jgi:hypothetical protein
MASALSCDLASDETTAPVVWSKGALPSDALRNTIMADVYDRTYVCTQAYTPPPCLWEAPSLFVTTSCCT